MPKRAGLDIEREQFDGAMELGVRVFCDSQFISWSLHLANHPIPAFADGRGRWLSRDDARGAVFRVVALRLCPSDLAVP